MYNTVKRASPASTQKLQNRGIHTQNTKYIYIYCNSGFSILLKDTPLSSQEIELVTLRLLDKPLYLLSHSHLNLQT